MSARPLHLSKPERGRPDDVRHLPVYRPSPHPLGPTKPYHRLLGTPARPSTIPRPSPTPAVRLEARTRAFRMRAPPARAATTPAPAGPYEIGPQAFGTPSPPLEVPPPRPLGLSNPERGRSGWCLRVGTPSRPLDVPPPCAPRILNTRIRDDVRAHRPSPRALGPTKPDHRRLRTPATPSLDVPHRPPAVYHPPRPLHPSKSKRSPRGRLGTASMFPRPPRPSRPYSPLRFSTPHHSRSLREYVSVRRSEKCSLSRAMELFARYLVLIACTSSIELWLAAPRFCSRLCATTPIRSPPGLDADEDDSVLECTDPAPNASPTQTPTQSATASRAQRKLRQRLRGAGEQPQPVLLALTYEQLVFGKSTDGRLGTGEDDTGTVPARLRLLRSPICGCLGGIGIAAAQALACRRWCWLTSELACVLAECGLWLSLDSILLVLWVAPGARVSVDRVLREDGETCEPALAEELRTRVT
ncbi:hypothetical protein B0H13DRAFT_2444745 [Mycena leptocephala]|nr:hypothetical protein B0H13DRAFT_2444745 [Mycena leptocephala]